MKYLMKSNFFSPVKAMKFSSRWVIMSGLSVTALALSGTVEIKASFLQTEEAAQSKQTLEALML